MIGFQILLRPPLGDDIPFIFNSWLLSHRQNEECRRMRKNAYFGFYKNVLDKIVLDSNIVIACNHEDSSQLYGYCVFKINKEIDATVLHYVYIKYTYRKLGIARTLLKSVEPGLGVRPIICTFSNKVFDKLRDKYSLIYDPAFRGKG